MPFLGIFFRSHIVVVPVDGLSMGVTDPTVIPTIKPSNEAYAGQPERNTEVGVQPREADHAKLRLELASHFINLIQHLLLVQHE